MKVISIASGDKLPATAEPGAMYRWEADSSNSAHYRERTNRNVGWITTEEQEVLRNCCIGIAGCGGMGGLLAMIFVRLGVGEVRIADPDLFDVSNLNRQVAAYSHTLGKGKAFETARLARSVSSDCTITVFADGITDSSATTFAMGCDVVLDAIEFWSVQARSALHRATRYATVQTLACCSVGFGCRLLRFDEHSATFESMLGAPLEALGAIEERMRNGLATRSEVTVLRNAVLRALVPEPRTYRNRSSSSDTAACLDRLTSEHTASIIATNPPLAAGFVANHALALLLEQNGYPRSQCLVPRAPGYLYFDSLAMVARVMTHSDMSGT